MTALDDYPTGPTVHAEPLEALDDLEGEGLGPRAMGAAMVMDLVAVMDDGTEYPVRTDARDHRAYAMLRHSLKLPPLEVSVSGEGIGGPDLLLLTAFCAWHALRYRHRVIGMEWAEWNRRLLGVDLVVPAEEDAGVDPTNPGRGDT